MKPKWIVSLVVVILFLIFLLQNTQVVTLRLYFWSISMSQIILIPLTLILGFVAGYIVARITGKHVAAIRAGNSDPGEVTNY
jgi:putative membrane protein